MNFTTSISAVGSDASPSDIFHKARPDRIEKTPRRFPGLLFIAIGASTATRVNETPCCRPLTVGKKDQRRPAESERELKGVPAATRRDMVGDIRTPLPGRIGASPGWGESAGSPTDNGPSGTGQAARKYAATGGRVSYPLQPLQHAWDGAIFARSQTVFRSRGLHVNVCFSVRPCLKRPSGRGAS